MQHDVTLSELLVEERSDQTLAPGMTCSGVVLVATNCKSDSQSELCCQHDVLACYCFSGVFHKKSNDHTESGYLMQQNGIK